MFKTNNEHEQETFFSNLDNLPPIAKKKLKESWAEAFYNDYFCKIDENAFKPMYSYLKSRPNTPVNILLGIETIKSGFGWSDEVLYENFLFNIQVRYALGLTDLNAGYFNLKTLYNFRSALRKYESENGINLVEKAFETVTDKQIEKFEIKTGIQRMDSTLVQSNIQNMGRLQLLVEFISRAHRTLTPEDQKTHRGIFDQYVKENALHYCYRIKSDEAISRLEQIGIDISKMLELLKINYNEKDEYKKLKQIFFEHYNVKEETIIIKKNEELKGSNLQSPDDVDATYRKKGRDTAKGCVSNVTETCDKENDLQLITRVSTESNTTDDQKLYEKDIKNINDRMGIDAMVTDGGYVGEVADKASEDNNIDHIVTAVKGKKSKKNTLGIDDFKIEKDELGNIEKMICPNENSTSVKQGRKAGNLIALFNACDCAECSHKNQCPTKESKSLLVRTFHFSKRESRVSETRKKVKNMSPKEKNIRASVESSVRSVIHPFGGHLCKLPVRGKFRIASMIILSAAMTNIRRIQYRNMKLIRKKARYIFDFYKNYCLRFLNFVNLKISGNLPVLPIN